MSYTVQKADRVPLYDVEYLNLATGGTILGPVSGITPTLPDHLVTKAYADALGGGGTFETVLQTAKIGDPTHIDTLGELYNHMFSSGIMHGCAITDNGDGTINLAAGACTLRAPGDTGHLQVYSVEVPAFTNITLTDNATNYVYISYNDGVTITSGVTTDPSVINMIDIIPAYIIVREGAGLTYIDAREQNVNHIAKNQLKEFYTDTFTRKNGGSVISDAGTLHLACTAGAFYFQLNEYPTPALDTTGLDTFEYYKHVAGSWVETDASIFDNAFYDNGTDLVAVGNNNYAAHWVYVIVGSTPHYAVVYGNAEYPNIAGAQTATVPATLPPSVTGLGVLLGRVITQQGNGEIITVETVFDAVYSSSLATSHNELAEIQGGAAGDYQHLTTTEVNKLAEAVTLSGNQTITGQKTISSLKVTDEVQLYEGGIYLGRLHNDYTNSRLGIELDGAAYLYVDGAIVSTGSVTGTTLTSTVAVGTAPISVTSTTKVTNLNADYLDGLQSTQFLRSDTADIMTGQLALNGGATFDTTGHNFYFQSDASDRIGLEWQTSGVRKWVLKHIYATQDLDFQSSAGGTIKIDGNTVWHAGNDGAGSGLDADLLGGKPLVSDTAVDKVAGLETSQTYPQLLVDSAWVRTPSSGILPDAHTGASLGTSSWNFQNVYGVTLFEGNTSLAAKYLGIGATAVNSALLDNLDSTQFLRSDEVAEQSYNGVVWSHTEATHRPVSKLTHAEAGSIGTTGTNITDVYGEADLANIDADATFTYAAAWDAVEGHGGRLPTLAEVMDGVGSGSGGGYDSEYLWTCTPAGPHHVWVVYGNYSTTPLRKIVDIDDPLEVYRTRAFFDVSRDGRDIRYDHSGNVNFGNDATFAGNVTTSGSISSATGSITGRLVSSVVNGASSYITADADLNFWKYLSLKTDGVTKWDIATKENDVSGALQFRPAGGSAAVYITTGGDIIASGAAINGTGTFLGNVTAPTFTGDFIGELTGRASKLSVVQDNLTSAERNINWSNAEEVFSTSGVSIIPSLKRINAYQFNSTISTGTAPLVIASTTRVDNLNAQYIDGYSAADFLAGLTDLGTIADGTSAALQQTYDLTSIGWALEVENPVVGVNIFHLKYNTKPLISVNNNGYSSLYFNGTTERMAIHDTGVDFIGNVDVTGNANVTGEVVITASGTSTSTMRVDSGGHANLVIDRASTSYDNNLLFYTAGSLKWRLWQAGADNVLAIKNEVTATNVMTFTDNNAELAANLDVGGTLNVGADLDMYSTSVECFINSKNDNHLRIQQNGVTAISAAQTGYVHIYHAGATKFNTTPTGVKVTGDIETSGNAIIDGNVQIGAAQEATISYNATDNSIDFIIN